MPKATSKSRGSSSSRAGQPHQDVVKLAQLLQRPVTNAAAAEEVVKAVIETLSAQTLLALSAPPSTTQDTAVRWSCVSAILRCAGWLVAARQALAVPPARLDRALMCCMWCSSIMLNIMPPVGPDMLRALLQPAAGSHVPGLIAWVSLAAAQELCSPAAATSSSQGVIRSRIEEGLVAVWDKFFGSWFKASFVTNGSSSTSRKCRALVAVTDWLHPSVMQLADKLLQGLMTTVKPMIVHHALMAGVSIGAANPMVHPQLAAATGQTPDAALAVQVAGAVQQDCWWRALATCIAGLAGTIGAAAAAAEAAGLAAAAAFSVPAQLPTHPSKFCPPYHQQHAYPGQPMRGLSGNVCTATASLALHVLLVAQLWDVWPWQLAQLQAAAADAGCDAPGHAGQVQGSSAASSSSVEGVSGGAKESRSGGDHHPDTSCGTTATASSSSSSSSQAMPAPQVSTLLGCSILPPDKVCWLLALQTTGIEWPLLPDTHLAGVQQEGQGLPPVTLQQLQLAVSALCHADTEGSVSAALLLALLLQRADAGLRAAFLAGPGGSALLAAAQYWGYSAIMGQMGMGMGMQPFTLYTTTVVPDTPASSRLLTILRRDSGNGAPDWRPLGGYGSLGLLLAWCYLVPAGGWEREVPAGWGPPPVDLRLVMTLHHYVSLEQTQTCMPECMVTQPVPGEALRFAPGCAPTPLLLGTLEALLRMGAQSVNTVLLQAVAAFVHATVVWLGNAPVSTSGGSSSSSGSSSGGGGGNSSSTSGGGSSSGGTGANAPDTADLLGALASLAMSMGTVMNLAEHQLMQLPWDPDKLQSLAGHVLPACCLAAAKLLQLARQQLAVPGPQARPAVRLAVAAQCLASVCAGRTVSVGALYSSAEEELGSSLWYLEPPVRLLLAEVQALRHAQPWRQQRRSRQQRNQPPGAAGAADHRGSTQRTQSLKPAAAPRGLGLGMQSGGPGSRGQAQASQAQGRATAAATAAAGTPVCGLPKLGACSSSSSSSSLKQCARDLLGIALKIDHACCPRVLLVGCSNPACNDLSGPSAEGLVAGRKGVRCGGCRVARYCSPACQQEDWRRHRHVCRRLAAGAGAHPSAPPQQAVGQQQDGAVGRTRKRAR